MDKCKRCRDKDELIRVLRQDIWYIRGMAKGKYLFPSEMCNNILETTTPSLKLIKKELNKSSSPSTPHP